MLLLADVEGLDKDMTIAHMQGKFQLEPVRRTGHVIQEDEPEVVADKLAEFWRRNQPLPPNLVQGWGKNVIPPKRP